MKISGKDLELVKKVLNELETKFILKFSSNDEHFGYNLTEGGQGSKGIKVTE